MPRIVSRHKLRNDDIAPRSARGEARKSAEAERSRMRRRCAGIDEIIRNRQTARLRAVTYRYMSLCISLPLSPSPILFPTMSLELSSISFSHFTSSSIIVSSLYSTVFSFPPSRQLHLLPPLSSSPLLPSFSIYHIFLALPVRSAGKDSHIENPIVCVSLSLLISPFISIYLPP